MSLDVTKLLAESKTPLEELNAYARTLSKKWEKTGLLDGLKNETERGNMAVLLENQARQLVSETTKTSTTANSEEWSGVALPLVRKVFAEIAAKEFVSVQPLNLPSGLIFYLDFRYGTAVAPRTAGSSMYGDTTSSAAPQGGLYGSGRFGYSINSASVTGLTVNSGSTNSKMADSASVNYDGTNVGSLIELAVPFSSMSNPDKSAIRAYVPSGSGGWSTYYPQYTRLSADQNFVIFVVSGSTPAGSQTIDKVVYAKQTTSTARGDFESTSSSPTYDVGIPEVDLQVTSVPIVAKTRKLKAVWTPELAQDLNAYHSIDAEAELTSVLSEYISIEIDLEILEMLLVNAKTTEYWSANIGRVWTGSAFATDAALNGQAWTSMTWAQTLGNKMQKVSNTIHKLTLRGGANFAVVSPEVATIIETIPGFSAKTDGNQASFAGGITQVGSFQNRYTIYKNPYLAGNVVLMGFRGSNFLETGAVYAPYIPLIMTPLVYDPTNFTPRRGVMTRYAKAMVRPEFYGKILIENLSLSYY
jgi:hypothetical protein